MCARSCRPPCRPLPPLAAADRDRASTVGGRMVHSMVAAAAARGDSSGREREEERTCMRAPHTHTHARALPLPLRALPLGRAKVLSDQSEPPRVKEVLKTCASYPNEARKPFVRKEWGFNLSLTLSAAARVAARLCQQ